MVVGSIPGGLGGGVGVALGGQCLTQGFAGAGQQRACGDVADAEGRGELEPGQVVQLREEEGRPLALGDARQRALQVAGQSGVHDEVLG